AALASPPGARGGAEAGGAPDDERGRPPGPPAPARALRTGAARGSAARGLEVPRGARGGRAPPRRAAGTRPLRPRGTGGAHGGIGYLEIPRARSSVGQSSRLIIGRSQVRALPGPSLRCNDLAPLGRSPGGAFSCPGVTLG